VVQNFPTPQQVFDLSTSKMGHESSVSWASFLPIFSFLSPSILDLWSGTGQTDGQTDNNHFAGGLAEA